MFPPLFGRRSSGAGVGAARSLHTKARAPLISGMIEWTSRKSPLRLAG
jgi:hypothetical protein